MVRGSPRTNKLQSSAQLLTSDMLFKSESTRFSPTLLLVMSLSMAFVDLQKCSRTANLSYGKDGPHITAPAFKHVLEKNSNQTRETYHSIMRKLFNLGVDKLSPLCQHEALQVQWSPGFQ